jgi:hypothetical protein
MSIAGLHAEWLSLIDVSGPFLSVSVLAEIFPNGPLAHDATTAAELRAAYDAWSDPEEAGYDPDEIHRAFVRFVLERVLAFRDDDILDDEARLEAFTTRVQAHDVELRPTLALMGGDEPLMLVTVCDRSVAVDRPVPGDAWTASPRERMVEMLSGTGCPLGLVTDGEQWTVVSRREGEAPGYATWWASLWREERITLRAFRTLLGAQQFFSVPEEETLVGLLRRSAEDQREVTTKLGNQTLDAVEILIRTIDRLDRDRGGQLLAEVPETELYDAAVTVMMRLIFLFFAEENDLLPMEEPLYVEEYAASSLRARLQEAADQFGEEVLETSSDAWPRLLSTWRAVFAGVEHGDMRLSPYGGSLFDPDRYPFLEGRHLGSFVAGAARGSAPDRQSDRAPLVERAADARRRPVGAVASPSARSTWSRSATSTKACSITLQSVLKGWVLGLSGTGGKEPEMALDELEALDDDDLIDVLEDRTGRNAQTIRGWLDVDAGEEIERRFPTTWRAAFGGDEDAAARARRFAKVIREDSTGAPTVFQPGSVYVCDSSHRGATGTHYTPRSFTEEIVKETLDPLVYDGIAEGKPEEEWRLRKPDEIHVPEAGRSGLWLWGVPGSGLPISLRQAGGVAETAWRARPGHDGGRSDRGPPRSGGPVPVRGRRESDGRRDGEALACGSSRWTGTSPSRSWITRCGSETLSSGSRIWISFGTGASPVREKSRSSSRRSSPMSWMRQSTSGPSWSPSQSSTRSMWNGKQRMLDRGRGQTAKRLRALADLLLAPSLGLGETPSDVERPSPLERCSVPSIILDNTDLSRAQEPARCSMARIFRSTGPWSFPRSLLSGGFHAVIGNPPFLGGGQIPHGTNGAPYREYHGRGHIRHLHEGRVDLRGVLLSDCAPRMPY